jgi:magnesium transporter
MSRSPRSPSEPRVAPSRRSAVKRQVARPVVGAAGKGAKSPIASAISGPVKPVGSVEMAGPAPAMKTRIQIRHADGTTASKAIADVGAILSKQGTCAWIDITDPTPEGLREVTDALRLHPLIADNIAERMQRAKIEEIDDAIHIVLFALALEGEADPIEIDFVLGAGFLLSVHDSGWDPYDAPQLRANPDAIMGKGADYLIYAIADWIVDGYFPVLDRLADGIDQLQEDVVERASRGTLQRVFALKRELIGLRRAVSPAREVFNQLTNREIPLVSPEHVVYFRDVYDHLLRVTDELDNYRELVSGTLDVYLSTVNNNLSLIMKRLTGVTVIVAGIGSIAGIFGMSEAGLAFSGSEAFGFWTVALGTVVLAAIAAIVLRRIDWI